MSIQLAAATAGSGSIVISDALNPAAGGDITPATLPADNATAGFNAIVYISIYNPGATEIDFGVTTPNITLTDSNGFAGATSCSFDVYTKNGSGGPLSWNASGATGTPSGNNLTIAPFTLSGGQGNGVNIKPGQVPAAVSCN